MVSAQSVFQNNAELSEIIMEINDLQKTFLDYQPLAHTMLEINDLRGFGFGFSTPFLSALFDFPEVTHFPRFLFFEGGIRR
jgi:hypothetical protein